MLSQPFRQCRFAQHLYRPRKRIPRIPQGSERYIADTCGHTGNDCCTVFLLHHAASFTRHQFKRHADAKIKISSTKAAPPRHIYLVFDNFSMHDALRSVEAPIAVTNCGCSSTFESEVQHHDQQESCEVRLPGLARSIFLYAECWLESHKESSKHEGNKAVTTLAEMKDYENRASLAIWAWNGSIQINHLQSKQVWLGNFRATDTRIAHVREKYREAIARM